MMMYALSKVVSDTWEQSCYILMHCCQQDESTALTGGGNHLKAANRSQCQCHINLQNSQGTPLALLTSQTHTQSSLCPHV